MAAHSKRAAEIEAELARTGVASVRWWKSRRA
jgi:hypothetical protein